MTNREFQEAKVLEAALQYGRITQFGSYMEEGKIMFPCKTDVERLAEHFKNNLLYEARLLVQYLAAE